jgi:hypothetical protein
MRLFSPFFVNRNENCIQNSSPENMYRSAFHLSSSFHRPVTSEWKVGSISQSAHST